jgi:hypothetical protein
VVASCSLVVAVVGIIPASLDQQHPSLERRSNRRSIETLWATLPGSLPPQPTYVELAGADAAFAIGPEVIRRLDVEGWTVRVPSHFASSFGADRVLGGGRTAAQTLSIVSDEGTLTPGAAPVAVLAAGRPDGSSARPFLDRTSTLLVRLRAPIPFVPTEAGAAALTRAFERSGSDPSAIAPLLAAPSRALFDERVLRVQVDGGMASSPLTDAEAGWLLRQLGRTQAIAYLLPAPVRRGS